VASDIGVDAAKTGMLASAPIMYAIAAAVRRLGITPFVVDPVSASQHGDPLLQPDAMAALRSTIIPLATLVTPNLNEVRLLTGHDVGDAAGMRDAARALHDLGPQWVLVKGGHLSGDPVDVLFDGTSFSHFPAPRHATDHTHGSGDTLAAAVTAALARGMGVPEAVEFGKRFVTEAVRNSFPLGAGLGPVGHFWRVAD
jgi:hydroxymethylpyrimidine/phosphomethylpyrimidine kinase